MNGSAPRTPRLTGKTLVLYSCGGRWLRLDDGTTPATLNYAGVIYDSSGGTCSYHYAKAHSRLLRIIQEAALDRSEGFAPSCALGASTWDQGGSQELLPQGRVTPGGTLRVGYVDRRTCEILPHRTDEEIARGRDEPPASGRVSDALPHVCDKDCPSTPDSGDSTDLDTDECESLLGKTGTGKTRKALWKMPDAYIKPNGKWWPLYTGQQNVIMDDFRAHPDFTFDELLRVLDRYPHIVETKGGHRAAASQEIYHHLKPGARSLVQRRGSCAATPTYL